MPDGYLNISHNFAGESNFIIVEWVRSTAQGTPVVGHVTGLGLGAQNDTDQTQVYYPAPHVNEQLQITELPETWFVVRFWRSGDGTSKDLLLLELAGNAKTGAVYPIVRYEYEVDRGQSGDGWADPVQGDTGLRDTRLAGKEYWVQERGTGDLFTDEITDRTDDGGGFDFAVFGKIMESGAKYVVYVITRVDLPGEDTSGGADNDDDIYIIESDQDFDPVTMGGRTIISNFAALVGTLTFGDLASLANSRAKVQTHGGAQRNVILQLAPGNTVIFRGQNVNKITLGSGEEIEFLIRSNQMHILTHNTGHERLGMVDYAYTQLRNSLVCDGTLYALADYPRVGELLDALPAGSIVNQTTYDIAVAATAPETGNYYPNRGKWMRDGANFRTPDLRSLVMKGLTSTNGSEAAGRYERQAIMVHDHDLRGSFGYGGYDGGGNTFFRIRNTTDGFDTTNDVVSDAGGQQNIVNNIGFYPIVHI